MVPTICLNMIVKNEADIIVDTLTNLWNYIKFDYWVISDTGSSDNTKEIICDFFREKGVPGELVEHEWQDFAYNRTKALETAFNKTDYLLIFDADDRIEGNFLLPPFPLTKDSYYLKIGKEFSYMRQIFVTNRKKWCFKGVLHEYICGIDNMTRGTGTIEGAYHVNSGRFGNRSKNPNKYYDDAIVLKNAFNKEMNEEKGDKGLACRYAFYCAQSYKDAGDAYKLDSIHWCKKVLELNNWLQEKYYACLMIGNLYNDLNEGDQAVRYWIKSSDYDKERIEGIVSAMEHLRSKGDNLMVNLLYYKFKKYNKNVSDDKLFVDRGKYNDLIEYNNSISAFYVAGEKESGYECCKKIIRNNTIGDYLLNSTLSNLKYYNEYLILKPLQIKNMSFTLKHYVNNVAYTFNSSSSCIIQAQAQAQAQGQEKKYKLNVRLVNYRINEQGNYLDFGNHIITMNKYFELDKDFNITFEKLIPVEYEDRRFIGIEDVRIFNTSSKTEENKLSFVGTGYHANNNIGIVYGTYLNNEDDVKTNILKPIELIPAFNRGSTCEKNWSFVNYKDEPHFIYSWNPLKIGKINTQTNELELVEEKPRNEVPDIFRHFRGSTNGFNYQDEIWFVVHWVSYESPRHYYHILVVFDKNMTVKYYSTPFKFEGTCIEYCIGLIVEEDRVIMTYSNWDRTTNIGIYDKKYIEEVILACC